MKEEWANLSVVEEAEIRCPRCRTIMAHIVVSEPNKQRLEKNLKSMYTKYKATDCPKCGESSFFTKVFEGSTNVCPPSDSYNLDVTDTDIDDNGVIVVTMKVLRRKNG